MFSILATYLGRGRTRLLGLRPDDEGAAALRWQRPGAQPAGGSRRQDGGTGEGAHGHHSRHFICVRRKEDGRKVAGTKEEDTEAAAGKD